MLAYKYMVELKNLKIELNYGIFVYDFDLDCTTLWPAYKYMVELKNLKKVHTGCAVKACLGLISAEQILEKTHGKTK